MDIQISHPGAYDVVVDGRDVCSTLNPLKNLYRFRTGSMPLPSHMKIVRVEKKGGLLPPHYWALPRYGHGTGG